MSNFKLIHGSCADQTADAVVNAANSGLIEGGGAGIKIAFTNQDVCFGNKLCCFNSYKNEIEKFIFYFLQSTLFTDAFKDNINGIIGGVSINNLKGMLFLFHHLPNKNV